MSIRTRPIQAFLFLVSLGLVGLGCQKLQEETPTDFEALQDASDAHLAYERGDCKTVERLAKPNRLEAWEANEVRFSMHLLDGFCKELDGDIEAARAIYEMIIEMEPNSFAARDAQERTRVIRINESDPGHASWMANARDRAMSATVKRVPVERKRVTFPPVARTTGIEGYAIVEFGVTPRGKTTDPVIVDSQPPFLFDGAALRAVRRWEYERKASAKKNDFQVIRLIFARDGSEATPTEIQEPESEIDSNSNADS